MRATSAAKAKDPAVHIVDDNAAVRDAIRWLVEQVGLPARIYASARDFLDALRPEMRGCIVLDIRMPGMSGLELQEKLSAAQVTMPVIIVTGHGDVPVTVRAMKAGAFEFLQKPFNDNVLLDAIHSALRHHAQTCAEEDRRLRAGQALAGLTQREREVLALLRAGKSNKSIAAELGISARTVEGHRANLMLKMNAKSLGQLVELALKAESS